MQSVALKQNTLLLLQVFYFLIFYIVKYCFRAEGVKFCGFICWTLKNPKNMFLENLRKSVSVVWSKHSKWSKQPEF